MRPEEVQHPAQSRVNSEVRQDCSTLYPLQPYNPHREEAVLNNLLQCLAVLMVKGHPCITLLPHSSQDFPTHCKFLHSISSSWESAVLTEPPCHQGTLKWKRKGYSYQELAKALICVSTHYFFPLNDLQKLYHL